MFIGHFILIVRWLRKFEQGAQEKQRFLRKFCILPCKQFMYIRGGKELSKLCNPDLRQFQSFCTVASFTKNPIATGVTFEIYFNVV